MAPSEVFKSQQAVQSYPLHCLGQTVRQIENVNVIGFDVMPSPEAVRAKLPLGERAAKTVVDGRAAIEAILDGTDSRLFVVVGPCSIHDPVASLEYAGRLQRLSEEVKETLYLVMRVYFEKPRTTVGWKGFVNDPYMDDSFRVDEGVVRARRFLLDVNELGLPAGTEALDPIAPQYYGDLIAWTAIGARTAESQTHREMSSGLSTPVGFKNGTDGEVGVAVNGILSASRPHSFLGINGQGTSAIVRTRGNRHGHLVLRGGRGRPNFDAVSIRLAEQALAEASLSNNIVVDCSHGNSWKNPELQPLVMKDVVHQIENGNTSVVGFMVESFLLAGNQPIPSDRSQLKYGCSVTDACLGWDTTARMLREAHQSLRSVLPRRMRHPRAHVA